MNRISLLVLGAALAGCGSSDSAPEATPGDFDHPQALVFVGDRLVVANSGYRPDAWGPGSITVVDPEGGVVVNRAATSRPNPQSLRVEGGAIYAVSSGIIDLSDFENPVAGDGAIDVFAIDGLDAVQGPTRTHALPVHEMDARVGAPVDLAIAGGRGVVTSALADVTWTLDLTRGAWSRGPTDPQLLGPDGVVGLGLGSVRRWSGGFVVVDFNSDRLSLLDHAGGLTDCAIELGEHADVMEGAGSPLVVDDTLYVVLSHAGSLRAVDLGALADGCDAPVRTVVDGLGLVPNDLRWHAGRLVVVDSGENVVVAYDPASGEAVERWLLPVGSNPWHAAFDPTGQWMAVSEWATHAVSIFDLGTGEVRRIATDAAPRPPAPTPTEILPGEPAPADAVVDAPGASDGPHGDPELAVNGVRGGGVGAGSLDVFSIPPGTHLTLSWGGRRVVDGPGEDLRVFENGFQHPGGVFFDPIIIELSRDGERWFTWPHRVLGPADDPRSWSGFAGLTPVALHAEHNPVHPFSAHAGGDGFDLSVLPDEGEAGRIKREGFTALRLVPAQDRIDPETGEFFPVSAISDGPDIDGVHARYFDAPE